jgi:hypothetical protein
LPTPGAPSKHTLRGTIAGVAVGGNITTQACSSR